MTLVDLLTTLQHRDLVPVSRAKDLKTSLRYLAAALGFPSPEQCPLDTACRDPATWTPALETHFQALTAQGKVISGGTRRNTRNNLRVVFRLAEAHGLLQTALPAALLTKPHRNRFRRQWAKTMPYQTTYRPTSGPRHYALPQAEWPPDIVQGWELYRAKCGLRLRETTLKSYARRAATYFGYLHHICGRRPVWEDLFDRAQLTEFLRWHAARLQRPITSWGHDLVVMVTAMAKVLEHPAQDTLADFRRGLKVPTPVHNKRAHWVSLATLDAVAASCLAEGRTPPVPHGKVIKHPGAQRAGCFQRGLILSLLGWVPLRQRNVREMQLGKHLTQDSQTGHWHLEFRGDELKVGNRGAEVNFYHVDLTEYCPEWLVLLEEFLAVHRPKLPNAATSQFLFLTQYGAPYSQHSLYLELATAVAMRTGQRFYPHLIRTIWATEYLKTTHDFTGAAVLLGDTVATVMKTYNDVLNTDYHAKARAFRLGEARHAG